MTATLVSLAGATLPARTEPATVDCTNASSAVEQLICKDAELATLDREVDRLFKRARDGVDITASRKHALIAEQRGWSKQRNDCWQSDDMRGCVASKYVIRASELLYSYADARAKDANSISVGPLVSSCKDLDSLINVTFVNSDPGYVHLAWRDRRYVLRHVVSGSGARYAGTYEGKQLVYWNKGREATLELPGKPVMMCDITAPAEPGEGRALAFEKMQQLSSEERGVAMFAQRSSGSIACSRG